MTGAVHRPVLLQEVIAALSIKPSGVYIDGTFGRGGHANAILQRLDQSGRLLAIDKDPEAVVFAKGWLGEDSRFAIERGSFAMLEQFAQKRQIAGEVDGILLDLGVSSPQLETPERGFGFLCDGPLDMRMDNESGTSASNWLVHAKEDEVATVLKRYGEERFAKRIARAIVTERAVAPIATTGQLADIITQAVPVKEKGKHPATRTFQAIRIFINQELDDLELALNQALDVMAVGGRLAVISFHSLEDRIVKRFIRDQARGEQFPRGVPVTEKMRKPRLKAVGKAIRPAKEEVDRNPRSRSAVLRVAECVQ